MQALRPAHGRGTLRHISWTALRCEPPKLPFHARLADHGERPLGFLGRNLVQRVADMDEHIVARRYVIEERSGNLLLDGTERDDSRLKGVIDGENFGGKSKTHGNRSSLAPFLGGGAARKR